MIARGYDVDGKVDELIFNMTFEMVAKVSGAIIDDYQIITNKEKSKEFEISFESVGAGTCMMVDFKDGAGRAHRVQLDDGFFCLNYI